MAAGRTATDADFHSHPAIVDRSRAARSPWLPGAWLLVFLLGVSSPSEAAFGPNTVYAKTVVSLADWLTPGRAQGSPEADCNNVNNYARDTIATHTGFLEVQEWQDIFIPAGEEVVSVLVDVNGRYDNGSTGNRFILRVSNSVPSLTNSSLPTWPQTNDDCDWRAGGAGWDISSHASWSLATLQGLYLGARRINATDPVPPEAARINAFRLTYSTLKIRPNPPSAGSYSSTSSSINVSWTPDFGGGPLEYHHIQRWRAGIQEGGWDVGTSSFSDPSLPMNTTYEYRIYGVNSDRFSSTYRSVTARTLKTAPSTPQGVSIQSVTTSSIAFTWSAGAGAGPVEDFLIERQVGGGGFSSYTTVGAGTFTFTDNSLSGSQPYSYRVIARNSDLSSSPSSSVSAKLVPAAPNNLAIGTVTASSISMSWSAGAGGGPVENHQVERRVPPGAFSLRATLGAVSSFNDTALSEFTLYEYRVRATNSERTSAYSGAASAWTSSTLSVSAVDADSGGNIGSVTVTVSGSGIASGATVRLKRTGQSDRVGTDASVSVDGTSLTATFDLKGAVVGAWDVVVTNPSAQMATLAGGFTVQGLAAPQLQVDLLGPHLMRANRLTAFDVVIQNLGNTDAVAVPLWITGAPAGALRPDFTIAHAPRQGAEPDWDLVPDTLSSPYGKYLVAVIPRIPPGTMTRRVSISVPAGIPGFVLGAALTPPWNDGSLLESCLTGVVASPSCMGGVLSQVADNIAGQPEIAAMSGVGIWAKVAWNCEGAATLPAAITEAEQALDFMVAAAERDSMPPACSYPLSTRWRDTLAVNMVFAVDPNDKLGPDVTGTGQAIPYTIRFENKGNGPAQHVVVVDALDLSMLDPMTVNLGDIWFGNAQPYHPPDKVSASAARYDLRPAHSVILYINTTIQRETGVLTWTFISEDPYNPGNPPLLDGFLPAGGEGSLFFTVQPLGNVPENAEIQNDAVINFDGVPTPTPQWTSRLATQLPSSAVTPFGPQADSTRFTVRWSGSGARDYSIYVSENNGPYRAWREWTKATADTFASRPGGNMYRFYSVARNSRNLEEAPPTTPDATIMSQTVAVNGMSGVSFTLEGAHPNPALGVMRVGFSLPSGGPAVLDLLDISGRRVARREVGSLGPGRHVVELNGSRLEPGLYFLRLNQGGRTLTARAAFMR